MLKKLLKTILLIDILEALFVGIKCIFQKPVTKAVSDLKRKPKVRSKISVCEEQCIKCGRCAKICPSKAIKVEKSGGVPTLDLDKCCYCRLCQKSCGKSAIDVKSKP